MDVGPQSIDSGITTQASFGPISATLWDRRDWLQRSHQEWHSRLREATQVANGNWYVVWPNLSQTPEAPTVANLVEMGVAHWQAVGGSLLPSLRVPVPVAADASGGKRAARKRERRVRELWMKSNIPMLLAQWWGDYAMGGSALGMVWADFSLAPKDRNPYFQRVDPRHTYVLKNQLGVVTEMLVARKRNIEDLRLELPEEQASKLPKGLDEEVEEWFWYMPDSLIHAVADVKKSMGGKRQGVILAEAENELGRVPAVELLRPSTDGARRGVFDQSLHILRTMHRLMLLTIQSSEEEVFSPIFEYDTQNPEDFGAGGTVHGRSAESRIERLNSKNHFDVKDLIARLTEEANRSAAFPQQLSGEPGASIVSARGIKASMGQIDARLAVAHKGFAWFLEQLSGMLLQFDEVYCDGEKTIYGDITERREPEKFIPSRDVAGAYEVAVSYGIGAGSDPTNREMRMQMHLSTGLVSQETARDQLDFVDDGPREGIRIARETAVQALLAGVYTQASQGVVEPAAKLLGLLNREDASLGEVTEQMVEFIMNPPTPPGGPQGADQVAAGAESLARGGIPGNAEQAPPAMGLPALSGLMSGATPGQVA